MNLIDTLADLVAFPSASGDLIGNEECFRYLRKNLAETGMEVRLLRSNKFPSLVALSRPGHKKPKILLQAHMDVVPAQKPLYKMTERAGKLYGRGVFDMKFAAACYLQLVHDLKDELDNYDFGIMFTADEEIGGANGTKFLLDSGYEAEICILPDAGDNWCIEISSNGVWIAELNATGVAAHGSRPWEGDNAIERLLNILNQVREFFPDSEGGKNSLTISVIKGGSVRNQVPDSASVTMDMRFIDNKEKDKMQSKIEDLSVKHKVTLQTVAEVGCIMTDLKHQPIGEFVKVVERVRGKPVGKVKSFGASDAHYFNARGIPTILMRPDGGGAHGDNEWIDKAGLLEFYEVLKEYVTETAKI